MEAVLKVERDIADRKTVVKLTAVLEELGSNTRVKRELHLYDIAVACIGNCIETVLAVRILAVPTSPIYPSFVAVAIPLCAVSAESLYTDGGGHALIGKVAGDLVGEPKAVVAEVGNRLCVLRIGNTGNIVIGNANCDIDACVIPEDVGGCCGIPTVCGVIAHNALCGIGKCKLTAAPVIFAASYRRKLVIYRDGLKVRLVDLTVDHRCPLQSGIAVCSRTYRYDKHGETESCRHGKQNKFLHGDLLLLKKYYVRMSPRDMLRMTQ